MRIALVIFLFSFLGYKGFAQCTTTPILVDLSASANNSTTISASRNGNCCADNNCNTFYITVNPGTDLINFSTDQTGGASFYTINCGPLINSGTPACISGLPSPIQISWCKPGANIVAYTIKTFTSVKASPDLNLRIGCTGTMMVNGLTQSSVSWTSIYPGTAGAYNSYLSQTTGDTTVTVTPQAGAPAYIDYQVSGIKSVCTTAGTAVVRVYTYPVLNLSITPVSPIICSGAPVTLTANATGGDPALTYLWNTGETTSSIVASAPGTYSVSVNDQTPCGPVSQSVNVISSVGPTAAPVSICSGNTATLNATAPGGPYQWYDAASGGTLLFTGPSYTTPVLTSTTTYYVGTTYGGCISPTTPVTVTVNPLPATPSITP